MNLILTLTLACLYILAASPAQAAFVAAAAAAIAASPVLALGVSLAASYAVQKIQQRRMEKKLAAMRSEQRQSGITTAYLAEGGTTPLSIVVGKYATAGQLEAPQMSQPESSDPPNKFMTMVISVSDMPGATLSGRVVINDEWFDLYGTTAGMEAYGKTVAGKYANKCWFKYYDGTQTTTSNSLLLNVFATQPDRPWLSDMLGEGICYVVATFEYDPELFPYQPTLRFEVEGIPLYDPRKDSSVGGFGSQRWSKPHTWTQTRNPKVIEYNIRRGIKLTGYGVWGGSVAAADLPLDNWFAAMNACDVMVDDGNGGQEPMFEFGFEISVDMTPASVLEEINRACAGETVEVGGTYKTRVGGVGLPVMFITDDDILVTRPQELDPFVGLEETFNALSCSFPDPELRWETREAPPLTNEAWELEDGTLEYDEDAGGFVKRPRRLGRELTLNGVYSQRQVQYLMNVYANEARRRRSHSLTLGPEGMLLEPLDAVSWTSARNGFAGKVFDVLMTVDPVTELRPRIALMEADPEDYTAPAPVRWNAPSAGITWPLASLRPRTPTVTERLYQGRSGALKVAVGIAVTEQRLSGAVRSYQWQRKVGDEWRDVQVSIGPEIEIADAEIGLWQMRVRALFNGVQSIWTQFAFSVVGVAAPPAAIEGAFLQSAGGLAVIHWTLHPDLDVQYGGRILIRHSVSDIPAWPSSTRVTEVAGGQASAVVDLMPGTYLLRAEDVGGTLGPVVALQTDAATAARFTNIGQLQEDDEFAGNTATTYVEEGELRSALAYSLVELGPIGQYRRIGSMGGMTTEAVYEFASGFDFGTVRQARLRSHVAMSIGNIASILNSRASVGDWLTVDGLSGAEGDVVIDIRTTNSDPATADDWSDWRQLRAGEVSARAIQARARLITNNSDYQVRVTELRLLADEVI